MSKPIYFNKYSWGLNSVSSEALLDSNELSAATNIKLNDFGQLVSREGLIVSAVIEEGISEMHIAAMSAIILSTCERVLMELKKGELDICIIQGTEGKFLVMQCGTDYIIVGVLDEDARMDLAFVNMRATTNRIIDILED